MDDNIDEPDETVRVTGSTTVAGLAVGVAHVVIEDNDAAPTVTLSLSDTSIGENGGTTTVTARLDRASGAATTVTISVTPVSPAVVADYSLSTNRTLTIAAGQTSSTRTVTLTAVNNDVDAADRTVTISGVAGNDVGVTGPADLSLTVEDDEERGVSISKTELAVAEGDDGTYTVELDTQPTESVTVTPSRSSGDPDVTVSGALTFTTSNWSEPQTVTVSARQDADAADDRAVIGHTVSGGDYDSVTAPSVTVAVDDDETPSTGVTLTLSPEKVGEGADATTVTVTARLNGGARLAETPITVSVGSGTAVSGTDFTRISDFAITIAENSPSATGTFSLAPVDDNIDEAGRDRCGVTGSTTVAGLTVRGASVEIEDNDAAPTVTLSLSDSAIGEEWRHDNGNRIARPRLQRRDRRHHIGHAGIARHGRRLQLEHEQDPDDRRRADLEHAHGDADGGEQRCGRGRQDGDDIRRCRQRCGGDGSGGPEPDHRRRRRARRLAIEDGAGCRRRR